MNHRQVMHTSVSLLSSAAVSANFLPHSHPSPACRQLLPSCSALKAKPAVSLWFKCVISSLPSYSGGKWQQFYPKPILLSADAVPVLGCLCHPSPPPASHKDSCHSRDGGSGAWWQTWLWCHAQVAAGTQPGVLRYTTHPSECLISTKLSL